MAKVTPEFKRALRHFINQVVFGEYWLLEDRDIAYAYGVLCGRKGDAYDALQDMDVWRNGIWCGLRWAFESLPDERTADFIKYVTRCEEHEVEILEAQWLPLYIGLPLAELTDDIDKWERLLMWPCDAIEREYKARAYDMLLKQIRSMDEGEHDERATELYQKFKRYREPRNGYRWFDLLTPEAKVILDLACKACKYWNAREANRLGRGHVDALYNAVELGDGEYRTGPITMAAALAMFCDAYSHGVDPLTGRRPQLPQLGN